MKTLINNVFLYFIFQLIPTNRWRGKMTATLLLSTSRSFLSPISERKKTCKKGEFPHHIIARLKDVIWGSRATNAEREAPQGNIYNRKFVLETWTPALPVNFESRFVAHTSHCARSLRAWSIYLIVPGTGTDGTVNFVKTNYGVVIRWALSMSTLWKNT